MSDHKLTNVLMKLHILAVSIDRLGNVSLDLRKVGILFWVLVPIGLHSYYVYNEVVQVAANLGFFFHSSNMVKTSRQISILNEKKN